MYLFPKIRAHEAQNGNVKEFFGPSGLISYLPMDYGDTTAANNINRDQGSGGVTWGTQNLHVARGVVGSKTRVFGNPADVSNYGYLTSTTAALYNMFIGDVSFTVMFWIYTNANTYRVNPRILEVSDAVGYHEITIGGGGADTWYVQNYETNEGGYNTRAIANVPTGAGVVMDDYICHLTVVRTPSVNKIYLNGMLKDVKTAKNVILLSKVQIGGIATAASTYNFCGYNRHIAFFNYAIPAKGIMDYYRWSVDSQVRAYQYVETLGSPYYAYAQQ